MAVALAHGSKRARRSWKGRTLGVAMGTLMKVLVVRIV